ncbi:MAG: hypothetical protein AB7O13_02970 [Alphaproteobacteria bacterium]
MTRSELAAPNADAARDELIALIAQYRLRLDYYVMGLQALESRLRQVTGGLTATNRVFLARMAAEFLKQHQRYADRSEWPSPLDQIVDLHRRLDLEADPDYSPEGPRLALLDVPSF